MKPTARIGVDIGGTFTDFVLHDEERGITRTGKRPTTPDQPSRAIIEGIQRLLEETGTRPAQINNHKEEEGYGAIRAVDPKTGERRWEFKMTDVTDGGILTTASDLLFTGGREGYFFALDARTGALLWKANLGGVVASGPISYAVGGRQYVAVSAGSALFSYALRK